MMDYSELVKALRDDNACLSIKTAHEAADAIEELLKAAKKMHTWIFLNTADEQKAYDECGLSDEMNAALGYGGRFELRAEQPKEECYFTDAIKSKLQSAPTIIQEDKEEEG